MRLIDADEFLRSEIERCGYVPFIGTCTSDNEVFKFALERQPTVDAVEVVRCKDCQYSHEPSILVKGLVECEKSCSGECLKREDWYCPLGERRGD